MCTTRRRDVAESARAAKISGDHFLHACLATAARISGDDVDRVDGPDESDLAPRPQWVKNHLCAGRQRLKHGENPLPSERVLRNLMRQNQLANHDEGSEDDAQGPELEQGAFERSFLAPRLR
jgi:hypothetical protein